MIRVKHYRKLSGPQKERTWEAFMAQGTSHSPMGVTLSYIMERCEQEEVPYRLTASPGRGYFIIPLARE